MSFFVGTQRIVRLFRGQVSIARAYRGSTLVFDRSASEGLLAVSVESAIPHRDRDTELSSVDDG